MPSIDKWHTSMFNKKKSIKCGTTMNVRNREHAAAMEKLMFHFWKVLYGCSSSKAKQSNGIALIGDESTNVYAVFIEPKLIQATQSAGMQTQ